MTDRAENDARGRSAAAAAIRPEDEVLLRVINHVLRERRLVAALALGAAVVTVVYLTVVPQRYAASAAFMPQPTRSQASVAGLAAQLGLGAPAAAGEQTPAFYVDLMKERDVLGAVVDKRYRVSDVGGFVDGTLVDVYGLHGGSAEQRRQLAIQRLARSVTVGYARSTGVVSLHVTSPSPDLGFLIVTNLLGELQRFNAETRRSRASAERIFVEGRLADAERELRNVEDRLQAFLQHNRDFATSPKLSFEKDRLQRQVAFRQQLFVQLSQSYEQARLDEVRDTPVITVVERPVVPVLPLPRHRIQGGALAFVLGGVAATLVAAARGRIGRASGQHPESARGEFAALRSAIYGDWRDFLGAIRPFHRRAVGANRAR